MWPNMRRTSNLRPQQRRTSLQEQSLDHFADYLSGLKTALLERTQPITVVFGNEAGDMDSMVSALSVAYFKHCSALVAPSNEKRAFVPLINIPRADLRLRPEVIRAFEIAFSEDAEEPIQASDLFARVPFRDEVDFGVLAERANLHVILTDHNRLAPFQMLLADRVQGVFDHHADEGLYKTAQDRIIDPVGSCCTLAARLWMANPEVMAAFLPRELVHLMLEAILVDTGSLGSSVTTEVDRACAKFLYTRLGRDPSSEARKAFFKATAEELSAAKKLLRQLRSDELLRRDCKEIEVEGVKVAISTISWSLDGDDGWLAREEEQGDREEAALSIAEEILKFARKRGLDMVLLLLRKGKGDQFERQIVAACRERISELQDRAVEGTLVRMGEESSAVRVLEYDPMDTLFRELEEHKDMDLRPLSIPGLGPETELLDGEGQRWLLRCYTQRNPDASRKKVVPALQEVIAKVVS